MTNLNFRKLINLVVGSPEPGHVNFRALHFLLYSFAEELHLLDKPIDSGKYNIAELFSWGTLGNVKSIRKGKNRGIKYVRRLAGGAEPEEPAKAEEAAEAAELVDNAEIAKEEKTETIENTELTEPIELAGRTESDKLLEVDVHRDSMSSLELEDELSLESLEESGSLQIESIDSSFLLQKKAMQYGFDMSFMASPLFTEEAFQQIIIMRDELTLAMEQLRILVQIVIKRRPTPELLESLCGLNIKMFEVADFAVSRRTIDKPEDKRKKRKSSVQEDEEDDEEEGEEEGEEEEEEEEDDSLMGEIEIDDEDAGVFGDIAQKQESGEIKIYMFEEEEDSDSDDDDEKNIVEEDEEEEEGEEEEDESDSDDDLDDDHFPDDELLEEMEMLDLECEPEVELEVESDSDLEIESNDSITMKAEKGTQCAAHFPDMELDVTFGFAARQWADEMDVLRADFCMLANKVDGLAALVIDLDCKRIVILLEALQEDVDEMKNNISDLKEYTEDLEQKITKVNTTIGEHLKLIAEVDKVKIDRKDCLVLLSNKVDYIEIQKKISLLQLEEMGCKLEKKICDVREIVHINDRNMYKVLEEMRLNLGITDLDERLRRFREMVNDDLKRMQYSLCEYIDKATGECEAAGTRIEVLKDLTCLSCDTTCVMRKKDFAKVPKQRDARGAEQTLTSMITFELAALRNGETEGYAQQDVIEYGPNAWTRRLKQQRICTPRHAGGPHTTHTRQELVEKVILSKKR